MRRGRIVTLWIIFGLGLLALIAAVYVSRDALLFRWKLRALAEWEGGSYVARSVKGDLPAEIADLSQWFIERPDFTIPRLRAELRNSDRKTKMAALHLLGKVQYHEDSYLDCEDFWHAFENKPAVEAFLATPFEVLLLARVNGMHGVVNSGVCLFRSNSEESILWRVRADTRTQSPAEIFCTATVKGKLHDWLRRCVARAFSQPIFPELVNDSEAITETRLYLLRGGRRNEALKEPAIVRSGSWTWLADVAAEYLALSDQPSESMAGAFDPGEAANFLALLIERGPAEAAEHAVWGFLNLDLSAADREKIQVRLRAVSTSGEPNVEWALKALENLAVPSHPTEEARAPRCMSLFR